MQKGKANAAIDRSRNGSTGSATMAQFVAAANNRALLAHYGLKGQAINARQAHENGDAEQSHNRFKTAVDQGCYRSAAAATS